MDTENNKLITEIDQSKTSTSIKENTKYILENAKILKEQVQEKNPELFVKFQKEYDDIRNATILALQEERDNIKLDLGNLKGEISFNDNLSDGKINEFELGKISIEFGEFHERIMNILNGEIKIEKGVIMGINEYLNFGINGFNQLNGKHYLHNQKEIINITEKDKLFEVLKLIKKENIKDKEIDKINFNNFISPELKKDFNIVKGFYEIQGKKLNLLDIKDLDFKNFETKDLEDLYNILDIDNFKTFIITGILEQQKTKEKINKIDFNEIKNPEILKIITESSNYIGNNENIFENYDFAKENLEKGKETNILEKEITKLINGEDLNIIGLDNFFNSYIDKNPTKFIQLFSENNLNFLLKFPKTIGKIINNNELIGKFIDEDPIIYNQLPEEKKSFFSIKYINSVLKSDKIINKDSAISKIRIKDFNQAKEIFNILDRELKQENLVEILKFSEIRSNLLKLIKNEDFNNYTSEEDKIFIEKVKGIIGKYGKSIEKYKNIVESSKLKETLKENKNNEKLINKIYDNNEFINFLKKENPNIMGPIVGLTRTLNGDGSKGENINSYISEIAEESITPEKLAEILKKVNNFTKEALNKNKEELEKKEQSGNNIKILEKNKNFLKEKKLNINGIKDDFEKYLINKKQEEGENFKENNLELYFQEYSQLNSFYKLDNNLKETLKTQLLSYIKTDKIDIFTIKLKENPNEVFKILKSKNQEQIDKLWKDVDKTYYKNIETKAKKLKEYEQKQAEKQEQSERLKNANYLLDKETGIISFNENGKETNIKLTSAEILLVDQNPETLENIVDFYKTLDRIGLSKLWNIKETLFKVIGNEVGIGFKIDKDYLNENEIKLFLNSILKSVGEKEISTIFTLNSFLSQIEIKNKTQLGGKEKIVNTNLNETYLENKFFNKFVPRNSTISNFNVSKFVEALNSPKK